MATIKLSGAVTVGGSGGGSYTLPTASTTVLGGVKIDGTTVTIANGVISATGGGASLPIAKGDSEIDIPDPSGNIVFTVDSTNQWTLGTDQVMTLPRGGTITETGIPAALAGSTIALKPAGGLNANQQLLVYPTAGGDNNHLHLTSGNLYDTELFLGSDDLYVKLANTGNIVMNTNDNAGNTAQWTFSAGGTTTLPRITTSGSTSESAEFKGQRKIIPPFTWSASLSGTTPAVCYSASSDNIKGFKATFMIQHSNGGFEMFDVAATLTGADTYYTVGNRVKPPSLSETTATVDGSTGTLQVTLTLTSGSSDAWVTFDATEFGIAND